MPTISGRRAGVHHARQIQYVWDGSPGQSMHPGFAGMGQMASPAGLTGVETTVVNLFVAWKNPFQIKNLRCCSHAHKIQIVDKLAFSQGFHLEPLTTPPHRARLGGYQAFALRSKST